MDFDAWVAREIAREKSELEAEKTASQPPLKVFTPEPEPEAKVPGVLSRKQLAALFDQIMGTSPPAVGGDEWDV